MKIRLFTITLLTLTAFLGACSSSSTEQPQREEVKFDPSDVIATQDNAPPATEQQNPVEQTHAMTITSSTAGPSKTERLLADSSKVTTSKDDAGNKVETRVFSKNSPISQIVVSTLPDGQKKVELYYNNSPSKPVLGDAADLVLSAPASEIESRLGFRPPANTTAMKPAKEGPPIEPVRSEPRVETTSPSPKSETPPARPKMITTVPQLPPVRTGRLN